MTYCNFIGIKSFCTAKETVNITKRQPIEWEKVSANDYQIMDSNPKINKELIKLNIQRTNYPIKKWAEDKSRHFSKDDTQMAHRPMKKVSPSLSIKEIQINSTRRYHLTAVGMATINKSGKDRCWRGCGERETPLQCWWECRLCGQPLWKTVWRFLKELKLELPYDSATAVLGISPKDTNVVIRRGACTPTFIAATSTRAKLWKEPRCPPTDEWIKQMWGMDREIGSYSYRSVSISIYLYLAIHLYLATSICHLSIYLSIYLSSVICHLS